MQQQREEERAYRVSDKVEVRRRRRRRSLEWGRRELAADDSTGRCFAPFLPRVSRLFIYQFCLRLNPIYTNFQLGELHSPPLDSNIITISPSHFHIFKNWVFLFGRSTTCWALEIHFHLCFNRTTSKQLLYQSIFSLPSPLCCPLQSSTNVSFVCPLNT